MTNRLVRWLEARGVIATVEQSKVYDQIDQEIDHFNVCRCDYRGAEEGTDFVGGCSSHKGRPDGTCEPHLHGYVRRGK